MEIKRKGVTWRILNILLISVLIIRCNCPDSNQDNLIVEQQKLIEDFKKKYVESSSASEFDNMLTTAKEKNVADIDLYIEELKGYKTIAESAKKAESATTPKEMNGYFDRAKEFIAGHEALFSFLAGRVVNAFTLYTTGVPYTSKISISSSKKKELDEQIVLVTKEGLLRRHHFHVKLTSLVDAVNCTESLITILQNVQKIKQGKK